MFYYLNFLITNFVIDFYAGVLQKKTFKLSIKKIELLFYQIFNIA